MDRTRKILVVDDDIDILEQVSLTLQSEGYSVMTAQSEEDGEEALLTTIPDLAIVDLMMEQKDSGFVLSHRIKKMYPEVPVILLTAVSAKTGLDFGSKSEEARSWVKADVLIDKPVRPEQLKNEVRRLLRE